MCHWLAQKSPGLTRTLLGKASEPEDLSLQSVSCAKTNLFTTHTAVAAGFDRFAPELIEQYLARYAKEQLGITVHDLLALGRLNPSDTLEHVKVQSRETGHDFEVEVDLDGLDPQFVRVELYADGDAPVRQPMAQIALTDRKSNLAGPHWALYRATVATTRPASDFTARIVPDLAGVAVPLELNLILWQR